MIVLQVAELAFVVTWRCHADKFWRQGHFGVRGRALLASYTKTPSRGLCGAQNNMLNLAREVCMDSLLKIYLVSATAITIAIGISIYAVFFKK